MSSPGTIKHLIATYKNLVDAKKETAAFCISSAIACREEGDLDLMSIYMALADDEASALYALRKRIEKAREELGREHDRERRKEEVENTAAWNREFNEILQKFAQEKEDILKTIASELTSGGNSDTEGEADDEGGGGPSVR